MKFLLIALSLVTVSLAFADNVQRAPYHAASFPTKPGEYIHKQWKYIYIIENEGTRSEKRIGKLYLEGKEVKGDQGELLQEHLGIFVYFGEIGFNQGWLNTLTYNQPVFDKNGEITADVRAMLFPAKKAQQGAAANP